MAEKVKTCIRKCKEAGVTVASFSQDMGNSNIATQKALGVSVDAATGLATSNSFFVDGDEIFCVADPAHLIKRWKAAFIGSYSDFILADDVVEANNLPSNQPMFSHIIDLANFQVNIQIRNREQTPTDPGPIDVLIACLGEQLGFFGSDFHTIFPNAGFRQIPSCSNC